MDRRHLIALLGGATLAWPLELYGQQPGRTYRLGALFNNARETPNYVALMDELRRQGFIEGQNLTDDLRGYELRNDQFPQVAMELVSARVDVIRAGGDAQFAPPSKPRRRFRSSGLPTIWSRQD